MRFFLQQQEITVYRLQTVSGDKKLFSTLTITAAHVQQLDEEASAAIPEASFGKVFKLWTDVDADVIDGDKIKDDKGRYYKVKGQGTQKRDFGICQHKEIILERMKS